MIWAPEKALALDKVDAGWKKRYFLLGVWLDDLLAESIERAQVIGVNRIGGWSSDRSQRPGA